MTQQTDLKTLVVFCRNLLPINLVLVLREHVYSLLTALLGPSQRFLHSSPLLLTYKLLSSAIHILRCDIGAQTVRDIF